MRKRKFILQKSTFKHLGQWHILPNAKIIFEPFSNKYAITFEITFLVYTTFLTLWIKQ
jgi:hypothetical protein